MSEPNQKFKWIYDSYYWGGNDVTRMPIGPVLSTPDVTTGVSYFCIPKSTKSESLMNYNRDGVEFMSTHDQPNVTKAVRNAYCIKANIDENDGNEYARAPVDPDPENNVYPFIYDRNSMMIIKTDVTSQPSNQCLRNATFSTNSDSVKVDTCTGHPDEQWDIPCGVPGSFSHPPCDAFYRIHKSYYYNYIPRDSTFYIPCGGTPTDTSFSGKCLFCMEPWKLTDSAYSGTTKPFVVWPYPRETEAFKNTFSSPNMVNISTYDPFKTDKMANFIDGHMMDGWWPPATSKRGVAGSKGYNYPEGHDRNTQTCTFPKDTSRVNIPQCGVIPAAVGTGEWWKIPGDPTVAPYGSVGNKWCFGGDVNGPNWSNLPKDEKQRTCPMEMIPQLSAVPGYTCPKYACETKGSELPKLPSNHGLSARISINNNLNYWWWEDILRTAPVRANDLLAHIEHTAVNFKSNAAWYPLFQSFGQTLAYDVVWIFEGHLRPTMSCAYTIYVDTNSPVELSLVDPTDDSLLVNSGSVTTDTEDSIKLQKTSLDAFEYATARTVPLLAGKLYDIKLRYTAPASNGPDPGTKEAIIKQIERRLVLSWSCPGTTSLYKKVAISSKYLFHEPDPPYNWNAAYELQSQLSPAYTVSTFGRVFDAFSSAVLTWDERVTLPLRAAGDAAAEVLVPVYAGLAAPVRLSVTWAAEVISASLKKVVYLVYAIGVKDQNGATRSLQPTPACMLQMGQVARGYGDAVVDSLPSTIEFFLDIREARASEAEDPVCAQYNHENFILAGALKSFYYASEVCNVRYINGTSVRCSLEDGLREWGSHCDGFTLPYSGFNTNVLCSADGLLVSLLRTTLQTFRILQNFAEALALDLIACLVEKRCDHSGRLSAASKSLNYNSMCEVEEIVVRLSGAVSAALSPGFSIVYQASGHPEVKGGFALADKEAASYLMTAQHSCSEYIGSGGCNGQEDKTLCVSMNGKTCVSRCTQHTDSASCTTGG